MFTHCILPYCLVLTGMGGVVAPISNRVQEEKGEREKKNNKKLFC